MWHLKLPHKVKVFIWQFCRNVIPVRKRLSSRGVRIPITCPMCHLFFDCEFAARCWEHANLRFDWSQVENANEWLLRKFSTTPRELVKKICIILWGTWRWRNKKVWDDKIIFSFICYGQQLPNVLRMDRCKGKYRWLLPL